MKRTSASDHLGAAGRYYVDYIDEDGDIATSWPLATENKAFRTRDELTADGFEVLAVYEADAAGHRVMLWQSESDEIRLAAERHKYTLHYGVPTADSAPGTGLEPACGRGWGPNTTNASQVECKHCLAWLKSVEAQAKEGGVSRRQVKALAEEAASQFDLYDGNDIPEEVFDWAIEVTDTDPAHRESLPAYLREQAHEDAPDFDAAMQRFLDALQKMSDDHIAANYPHSLRKVFYGEAGPKYVRVISHEGPMDKPITRSAFAFVERSTGNILKPDGWKRPAKGIRGSIFNENPLVGVGPYGVRYLR